MMMEQHHSIIPDLIRDPSHGLLLSQENKEASAR